MECGGKSRKIGEQSEHFATEFLERNGYSIVERNYYASKLGEIDIIALKDSILDFIEVKSSQGDFDPIYNITPQKLCKVINSVHYYMKSKKLDMAFSIDVLIVRRGDVELIENITL